MRKRSAAAAMVTFVAAWNLAACGSSEDYDEVCRDDTSDVRAEDVNCEQHRAHHSWVYIPHSYATPRVGSSLTGSHYVATRPASGFVSRSGFGGRVPAGS